MLRQQKREHAFKISQQQNKCKRRTRRYAKKGFNESPKSKSQMDFKVTKHFRTKILK